MRKIKQTIEAGGATQYTKGDKISVTRGDLCGLKGTVLQIDENMIQFKPLDMPQLTRPLIIDVGSICKYFEPSDQVRVTEGKYKGDTGRVIDVNGKMVCVILDKT